VCIMLPYLSHAELLRVVRTRGSVDLALTNHTREVQA